MKKVNEVLTKEVYHSLFNSTGKLRKASLSVVTLCTTMARKGIQRKIPRDCHVTDNFAGQKRTHWTQWLSAPFGENQKIVGSPFFHYRNNFSRRAICLFLDSTCAFYFQ